MPTQDALLYQIAIYAIPLLCAITLHEVAHGWVAHWRGDSTAYLLGRTSLNPFEHVDLFGTILLPTLLLVLGGFIFGWAKPVPVNARLLRNPRWDMAWVALAGPTANALMALCWALCFVVIMRYSSIPLSYEIVQGLRAMCIAGIKVNVFIGLLNCLPLPPLDGSRILEACLPRRWAYYYQTLEPYGLWITLALLWLGILTPILQPMYQYSLKSFMYLIQTLITLL